MNQTPMPACNIHFHQCPDCLNFWGHEDGKLNDVKAHTCSKCGQIQWLIWHQSHGFSGVRGPFTGWNPETMPYQDGWLPRGLEPETPVPGTACEIQVCNIQPQVAGGKGPRRGSKKKGRAA